MNPYEWPDRPSQTAFPVARAGWPFIAAAAFATLVAALLGLVVAAVVGLAATFAIAGFFRDPDRVTPTDPKAIVSPADGKVIRVETLEKGPFGDGPVLKISIFMTVFNVHVNRIPFSGQVTRVDYRPGRFFAANKQEAVTDNEQNAVFVQTVDGWSYCVIQIAGLVARRIICRVQPGDPAEKGSRFGMICFGSRLDVYLPSHLQASVRVGEKVRAGTSVVALATGSTATAT